MPPLSVAFPYVHTDIVTFINGQLVTGYNIGGSTVIRINDITDRFGSEVWDPVQLQLRVTLN
jgi:hypothetical protein